MARVKEWRKDEPEKKLHLPSLLVSRGGRRVALVNFLDVCKRYVGLPHNNLYPCLVHNFDSSFS